ncbi:MAG: threonine synthase [Kiritimatiellae bacterium]|nr:threonine synthase [Kiritimatiellia bacterium]
MTFTSTRGLSAVDSLSAVRQGLAPDGGLFVPTTLPQGLDLSGIQTLADAERLVLGAFFDDVDNAVREKAVTNLLAKFPANDPIPLVAADGFQILELFHGPTGAFKDVALSVLPVLMVAAAQSNNRTFEHSNNPNNRTIEQSKVLILTATSGDTGSAAMAGFADVPGIEIAVFFPNTGTSRIQRLQMTTPAAKNVHGIAIRGNFDDAQAAVKRIFADAAIRAQAAEKGVWLSSANSINIGRLVPQVGYYLLAAAKLAQSNNRPIEQSNNPNNRTIEQSEQSEQFDVVVPSGNFGNILAAYYAKQLGAPIRSFICASNVNNVLTRFIQTGTYDPGETFTVTNSPSMDIRKSSNVERLLWLLNGGLTGSSEAACAETKRLMDEFAATGRYTLNAEAKARLQADFSAAFVTPEETEAEMRLVQDRCGHVLDPHTAVATAVARKLGYPKAGRPCVVAATATPYKFPETCQRAFGRDVLTNPPPSFAALESAPITQTQVVDINGIDATVTALFD